jgi:hypothetical protein
VPVVGELVADVRRELAAARPAHLGWDWAVTMNPETFALLGIPVQSVESSNPHTRARYTAPGLWGAELFVLQLVHAVVLCSRWAAWTTRGRGRPRTTWTWAPGW